MEQPIPAAPIAEPSSSNAPRRFWMIAAAIILALFAGYWLFLRTSYDPMLVDVAPQDAADIIKVLEDKKIAYQLADGGSTIRVASGQADKARIDLIGSELTMRGQVGFELFNQSDMGLTEFAQKINYQRALQGELARTILLLDTIQSVRVHLALPDHSLFRDEQSQPKASVTLILKPGKTITEGTVAGIQRLVAGSIPDMAADAVTVLDGSGRIVSREGVVPPEPLASSDAIIQTYRRQITAAIAADHPELRFDVNVSLRYLSVGDQVPPPAAPAGMMGEAGPAAPAPRGDPDYALAVRITTRVALDDSLRGDIARIVQMNTGFAAARGDAVVFLTGPLVVEPSVLPTPAYANRIVANASPDHDTGQPTNAWLAYWPALVPIVLILLAAAYGSDRRRGRTSSDDQLIQFADQLRQRLSTAAGPP